MRLICLLFALTGMVHAADKPDVFLDQPLSKGITFDRETLPSVDDKMKSIETTAIDFRLASVNDFLRRMGEVTGKKVSWPEGIARWSEEKGWSDTSASAMVDPQGTRREACDRCAVVFGLLWRYDAARDEILLTPDWRRTDSRTGRELVRVLLQEKPVSGEKLRNEPQPDAQDRFAKIPDAWRVAFDALLSLPGDYASAGALRFFDDAHGNRILMPWPERKLLTTLVTENGQKELLVINGQERMSSKSPATDLACYLFDEDGRFLGGQILVPTWGEADITQVALDGDHRVAVTLSFFGVLNFKLKNHVLTLESSVGRDGRTFDAAETSQGLFGSSRPCGVTKCLATPTSIRMLSAPLAEK